MFYPLSLDFVNEWSILEQVCSYSIITHFFASTERTNPNIDLSQARGTNDLCQNVVRLKFHGISFPVPAQSEVFVSKHQIPGIFPIQYTRRSGRYAPTLLAPAEGWGPCGPCWGPSVPSRVGISKLESLIFEKLEICGILIVISHYIEAKFDYGYFMFFLRCRS